MSVNATAVPLDDAWNGFLASAEAHLPQSPVRLALLALVNIPILAIVLNVLWQWVCTESTILLDGTLMALSDVVWS
jgi:sterol 14-demethylase